MTGFGGMMSFCLTVERGIVPCWGRDSNFELVWARVEFPEFGMMFRMPYHAMWNRAFLEIGLCRIG
jgi:hypothetical protein